jgi:hypothetical protein
MDILINEVWRMQEQHATNLPASPGSAQTSRPVKEKLKNGIGEVVW